MKARLALLLFLGSVFLAVASVGLARSEQQGQDEPTPVQHNPYYIPSDRFQTRFENKNGQIRVLEQFDKLSQHLQFLKDYRIVQYKARPQTVVLPHYSDAEFLLIITRGSALVTVSFGPNAANRTFVTLNQYDALRVPAGAVCYTINDGGSSGDEDLEFIKLALPSNLPGQFEDLYPTGKRLPTSLYKVFEKNTLQAAFNAPYEEIQDVLWGSNQRQEEAIAKLPESELRSLIRHAQSRSEGHDVPATKLLGPIRLRRIKPRYSNDHGSLHEAWPLEEYPALDDLDITASYLRLNKGSLFLPHYNSKAIVVSFVANGKGHNELGSPYPVNRQRQQQQSQEAEEGYIESLPANLNCNDLYIVPAGFPTALSASENNNLEVVQFILNAHNNSRMFLTGAGDNVVNHIPRELLSRSPEKVEKLLEQQQQSFFVNRKDKPKSPRKGDWVAWS